MTAQQLKNSILQLAVQGKLVPQDKNDEPASELLKRIRAEKAQLIKAGKIKKEKALPPITEDEIPFDIPDSWEWVKLGIVTSFQAGKTPARNSTEYWEKGVIPWVSISDMVSDGLIEKTTEQVSSIAFTETFKEKISVAGTLIMSFKLTMGKVSLLGIDAVHNEAIISIYTFADEEKIFRNYLMKVLPYITKYGDTKNAIKGKTLNDTSLNNLFIPLPPLVEQQRIVSKIEQYMPLIEAYGVAEEQRKKLDEQLPEKLKKSILQQAVQGKLVPQDKNDEPASELLKRIRAEKSKLIKDGKIKKEKSLPPITDEDIPFDIPESWEWVKLWDICEKIGAGSTPTGGSAVYVKSGIKFLREQNVHNEGLLLDNVVYIDEMINQSKSGSQVYAKDILMNITGGSIGRNSVVPDDFDIANVNQHVLIVRLVDKNLQHFLHYCFLSPFVLNQMFTKQIGDKPGLSATTVKNFVVPIPPLAEQQRIVSKIEEYMELVEMLKNGKYSGDNEKSAKIISFPIQEDEPLLAVARGEAADKKPSKQLQSAIEDLFEDE